MYYKVRNPVGEIVGYSHTSNGVPVVEYLPLPDRHPINASGATTFEDPSWTLEGVKAARLEEIRGKAQRILYAKWPQWLRDNINRGMDAPLAAQYDADVALIRAESGCANAGEESGFEGGIALLTTIDDVLAYTYSFTSI